MKFVQSLLSFVVLALSFVASAQAQGVGALPPVPADKAQIVFMKPMSGPWGAMNTGIFEVMPDGNTQVGVMDGGTRLIVDVDPGEHRFMAVTMPFVHFLDAKVEAGKRYYVLARFLYGNGFQLRPIRPTGPSPYSAQSPDFSKWLSGTRIATPSAKEVAYFVGKKEKIEKYRGMNEKIWMEKTDAQRAELTLLAEDSLP